MTDQAPEQPQYPWTMTAGVIVGGLIVVGGLVSGIVGSIGLLIVGLLHLVGVLH